MTDKSKIGNQKSEIVGVPPNVLARADKVYKPTPDLTVVG